MKRDWLFINEHNIHGFTPQEIKAVKEIVTTDPEGYKKFLYPKQREVIENLEKTDRTLSVVCLPRQCGKSFLATIYLVNKLYHHKKNNLDFRALWLAQDKQAITNQIAPKINFLSKFYDGVIIKSGSSSDRYVTMKNSLISEYVIHFYGFNKADTIRGISPDFAVIDEAMLCKSNYSDNITEEKTLKYIYESVILPTFNTKPHAKCLMISTPPDNVFHDFTRYFIPKAKKEKTFTHFTYKDLPDDILAPKRKKEIKEAIENPVTTNAARREYEADYSLANFKYKVITMFDANINKKNVDYFKFRLEKETALQIGAIDLADSIDHTGFVFGLYLKPSPQHNSHMVMITHTRSFNEKERTNSKYKFIITENLKKQKEKFKNISSSHPHIILDVPAKQNNATISAFNEMNLDVNFSAVKNQVKRKLRVELLDKFLSTTITNEENSATEIIYCVDEEIENISLRKCITEGCWTPESYMKQTYDFQRSNELGHLDTLDAFTILAHQFDKISKLTIIPVDFSFENTSTSQIVPINNPIKPVSMKRRIRV